MNFYEFFKKDNKRGLFPLRLLLITIIISITTMVIIFIYGNKNKSDFSDLVSEFYNITPIDIQYAMYDSSKPGHVQPILAIFDDGITDKSNDFFLRPLFFSKKSTMDINATNIKSLGILDVSYGEGTKKKQQSFVRMTTIDDKTYFKKVDNKNELIFDNYYPGIENDILRYMGNKNWYSY